MSHGGKREGAGRKASRGEAKVVIELKKRGIGSKKTFQKISNFC
jgi:hypothetical protein